MLGDMNISLLATLVVSLLPLSAAEAAIIDHEHLLERWEEEERWMQTERETWRELLNAESSADLFPAPPEEEGVIDDRRTQRIGGFLEVRVGRTTMLFVDISRDEWFAPYVREIAERGIVSGYRDAAGNPTGSYGPADTVTVGQLAKIAVEASASGSLLCGGSPLNATASGGWMAPFVQCAEQRGWSLFADGTVDVSRPAARGEVVVTMLQALNVPPEERTGEEFTDVTFQTSFGAFIEQAKRDGIVSGYTDEFGQPTGAFGPADSVTRAEIAKIVTLALQIYAR